MSAPDRARHFAEGVWLVLVVLLAAGYVWQASRIPTSLLDDAVGPSGVPLLLGLAVLSLGVLQALRTTWARPTADRTDVTSPLPKAAASRRLAPLVTLLLGLGYGAVLPLVGYAGSIFLLLTSMSAYHAGGLNRQRAVVAAVGAATFWGLFVWLLGIPQPAGLWAGSR